MPVFRAELLVSFSFDAVRGITGRINLRKERKRRGGGGRAGGMKTSESLRLHSHGILL